MTSTLKDTLASAAANSNLSFSIEVIDYYLQDDAVYYQNHIFILQMFLEQNDIRLYRSYAAFCELDTRLRRQYPRSSLPTLPLAGVSSFQKKGGKRFSILSSGNPQANGASTNNIAPNATALDVRESMFVSQEKSKSSASTLQRGFVKRSDNNQELIPNRKPYLTRYLNDLLRIPEVVMSDTFQIFLDEESPMDNHPSHIPEYNEDNFQGLEINLLLQEELPTTKTISKEFMLPLSVYQGGVVVWSFETKQHDIGFSIAFDGKEIVAYQRVQSHTKPIQGYFEVPKSGQMLFLWDNSYSKWRNKQMSYIVRIVDKDSFREILDQATSMVREKLTKHKQRTMLKKVLGKLAHDRMFAVGSNDGLQHRMQLQQQQQLQSDRDTATSSASSLPNIQDEHQHQQQRNEEPLRHEKHDDEQEDSGDAGTISPTHNASNSTGTLTDITAFYPPPNHPPPNPSSSSSSSSNYPRLRSSIYAADLTADLTMLQDDSPRHQNASGGFRSSSLLPSSADHEITIKVLNQQLDTLKSEKSFLQQALAQAESALVQERSACASNFQQVEDMTMSKEMMEEELQGLQEENEQLRKELHELVQQQQERSWLTSSASSKMLDALSNSDASLVDPTSDSNINSSSGSGGYKYSEAEKDMIRMLMEMPVEEFLVHYQPPSSSSSSASSSGITDNIRQLLALHHFPGMVTFTRGLLSEKKQLQEQIVQLEQAYNKQKVLAKQLKSAAIQLKEQQSQSASLLQQIEHDKGFVVAENETLAVKIRSYENQIRVLQKEWKDIYDAYQSLFAYTSSLSGGGATPAATTAAAIVVEPSRNGGSTGDGGVDVLHDVHLDGTEAPPATTTSTSTLADDAAAAANAVTDTQHVPQTETAAAAAAPSAASVAERMKQLAMKNQQKKQQLLQQQQQHQASSSSSFSSSSPPSTTNTLMFPSPQSFRQYAPPTTATSTTAAAAADTSQSISFPTPDQILQKHQLQTQGDGKSSSGGNSTNSAHSQTSAAPAIDAAPAATDDDDNDYFAQYDTLSPKKPEQKLVVHDFAKAEPDEISAYLSQMTSTFMSMLGVEEDEWEAHMQMEDESATAEATLPHSSSSGGNLDQRGEELTSFRTNNNSSNVISGGQRRHSAGVAASSGGHSPSTTANNGTANNRRLSGGNGTATSSSFLSSLKQMSFGF